MSNEILDNPQNDFPKIRKAYFSVLEFSILIANGLFILIGVFICWRSAFIEGTWLFLVNPTIFILLFGIPPFHFIYQWRKASLEYDASKRADALKKLSNHVAILLTPIVFGLLVLLFLFLFLRQSFLEMLVSGINNNGDYILYLWLVIVFLFFVILGPVQFFFIRKASKINKQLLV
jgi:hypothetical protein